MIKTANNELQKEVKNLKDQVNYLKKRVNELGGNIGRGDSNNPQTDKMKRDQNFSSKKKRRWHAAFKEKDPEGLKKYKREQLQRQLKQYE